MAKTVTFEKLGEIAKQERARANRLDAQLRQARAEIEALKAARDTALRLAAWGGARRIDVSTRDEH